MKQEEQKMSEGEEYILDYLKEERIRFRREEKIPNLKGDHSAYRMADFCLIDYGVYLEFFGQWNHGEEHRQRYRQKKSVYFNNSIPCIYIYPENLGILDFLLFKRMTSELKRHKKKQELFRWRLINSLKTNSDFIWGLALSVLFFILCLLPPISYKGALILGILVLIFASKIIYQSVKIFKS